MSLTLAGADIHGFYHQLGIPLPDTPRTDVSIRCFADPDAHHRSDRDPSCSINTITGAWRCHGCGAHGGAYDAALTKGHTPRSAIDLMITHRLTERRSRLHTARELLDAPHPAAPPHQTTPAARRSDNAASTALLVTDEDVDRYQAALSRRLGLLAGLAEDRGWRYQTIRGLQLGFDRGRITIPIRDRTMALRGLLRYQPGPTSRPKMLAAPGSRLGLIPHPSTETSQHILLVEGPPDMIAARSHDLPAIAVPGDHAWQPAWARLLARRHITIVMDADRPGRDAAARIAHDLTETAHVNVVDLAPDRDDGYDLTDWLQQHDPGHLQGFPAFRSAAGVQRVPSTDHQ
jgi:hypothetical protein